MHPENTFLRLWRLSCVTPVTSAYALGEVHHNIKQSAHHERFDALAAKTRLVSDANTAFVPNHIQLAEKDKPILAAAIAASVDYLITGDKNHFSHLYSRTVAGVSILPPSTFLAAFNCRLQP